MGTQMRYGHVEGVDREVSRILFGTAIEPMMKGEDATELLDGIWELGINTFDCARQYGRAEESLGKWIRKRGLEGKAVVLSKCGHPDALGRKRVGRRPMYKDLETSLEKLGVSCIDIYLLHRDDEAVEVGEIVEIFNEMHDAGKIRAFGGSNWSRERIEAANAYAAAHGLIPFAVSSPNFGLADQVTDPWGGGCVSISGPSGASDRAWYAEKGMPVIAYSSLARGFFSGKLKSEDRKEVSRILDSFAVKGYVSEENFERLARAEILAKEKGVGVAVIALAYIFGEPVNTFAVASTRSRERMTDNLRALDVALTEEERDWLDLRRENR